MHLTVRSSSVVRLRGCDVSVKRSSWAVAGAVIGAVSALLPTGYFDADGAGLVGGGVYALYGLTAASPVVLTALMCAEVAGDYERGLHRDIYLSDGSRGALLIGAIWASAWSWIVLATAALAAGALVGLGDGLRQSAPLGWNAVSVERLLICLALQGYVAIMAVLAACLWRRSLASVLVLFALLVAGIVLTPAATAASWESLLRVLPYSPLVSQLDPALLGRLSLPTQPGLVAGVMASWVGVGSVALVLRSWLRPSPS